MMTGAEAALRLLTESLDEKAHRAELCPAHPTTPLEQPRVAPVPEFQLLTQSNELLRLFGNALKKGNRVGIEAGQG